MLACSSRAADAGVPSTASVAAVGPGAQVEPWLDRPLREQVAAMQSRVLASEDLTLGYLDRIDLRDDGPEGIHAVLALVEEPARRAAELDRSRGDGLPLHGAVVLVKDNIDMHELPTTVGSLAMTGNVPDHDATAIAKLRAAGALLLGKTNLSEWANFRGYGSSSGWSSLGGQTRNGVDGDYTPCGSSSGSAAAVAAGLASAAIGTETDGSIVCPAAMNGVVGFKPTVGLVSRTGIVPISRSQDTAGPITKTVGDAARVLGTLAGADPTDSATAAIPAAFSLDFESPMQDASLYGVRLGVVAGLVDDPRVAVVFADARARLEAAGAVLVDVQLPPVADYADDELVVMLHEFRVDLDAYLRSHARPGQPASLTELIAFDRDHAETVMPFFGQELFVRAAQTGGLDDAGYRAALVRARRSAGDHGIVAVLAREKLDALIAPTASPAWRAEPHAGDPWAQVASSPAAVAGGPHLTVPMGHVDQLPVGLSIFAGPWRDHAVLALGHAFEQL
ncbi:MAG: amidase [Deltaproteobacteria bacterium]|nr:amidase [Nannocystaceae bacterium]